MEDAANNLSPDPADPTLADSAASAPHPDAVLCPELLAAVPAGPQPSQEELVEQIAESHIRVVRIGGVPLETIGTIAAAILIEAVLFTGGYLLATRGAHWFGHVDPDGLQRTVFSVETDDGGSGTGGAPKGTASILGEPELAGESPIAAIGRLAHGAEIPIPYAPSSANAEAWPTSILPDEAPLVAFGLASAADAPKAKLPHAGITVATAPSEGPRIDHANGPVALASAAGSSPRAVASSLGAGEGGDDEEYVITNFVKPGKGGGVGSGSGSGRGKGTDRGPSFANHDTPAVLESPRIELPEHIRRGFVPIKGGVLFTVTVEPDGKPSNIKLMKSCGNAEVDTLMRTYVAATKFRPAYRAGKPISATMDMSFFADDAE